jgi:hypothetical protein
LPFDADTQRVTLRLREILREVLIRPDLSLPFDEAVAGQDVLAIVKGMADAAGERGELDQSSLVERVSRAVYGYLDGTRESGDQPPA